MVIFQDKTTLEHVLSVRDFFFEQYKPYELVYEYRWVTEEVFGLHLLKDYKTDEEMKDVYGKNKQRLDFTKRERK